MTDEEKQAEKPEVEVTPEMLDQTGHRAAIEQISRLINAHQMEECDDLDIECAFKVFSVAQASLG